MEATSKALGAIGALHTLIRNFPMDILDMNKGKVYTSAFDFIMDILYACGVSSNEIVEYLLKEIYSINIRIDDLYTDTQVDYLKNNLLEEQSPFLIRLESSLKDIIMTLLSSIFTCSAIPAIPNKLLDKPSTDYFLKYGDNKKLLSLWEKDRYPEGVNIPVSLIDPMGILEISPTTAEGRMYYMIEGRDVYYKKSLKENDFILGHSLEEINNIPLYLSLDKNGYIIFNLETMAPVDIEISVGYVAYNDNNLCTWVTNITTGKTKSNNTFKLLPKKGETNVSIIKWIKINGNECNYRNENSWVYLDKEKSIDVINLWISKGAHSIENIVKWGKPYKQNMEILGRSNNLYEYIECGYSKESKNAIRTNKLPEPNENSPEYIVCYEGITTSDLYKTMDMNAFLWYCLRRGVKTPYTEFNHMMWDSRLSAKHMGVERYNNSEWNNWYNSKKPGGEFKYNNNIIKNSDALFPILQINPINNGYHALNLTFPAQTYYKPQVRDYRIKNPYSANGPSTETTFNSSIYKFNRDYLNSIQILRPKLMLVGLCNYLLGFSMSEALSTRVSLTKKMIQAKLSTAIKKIIEADDMEIEDCYTTFSNEEFDEMLKDMLLSKYDSTYYGGETNKIKKHEITDYINNINSISDNIERSENIEVITRLITQITSDPGNEASIEYGLQVSTDGNILNKLIWAITMPIIESLFTPQVMLLLMTNYVMTGVVKLDNFSNNDMGLILNLLLNKILGLTKSVVKWIKDVICELLLKLYYYKVEPHLERYTLVLASERVDAWLKLLNLALSCSMAFKYKKRNKLKTTIDDVNYADITQVLTLPDNNTKC